MLYTDGYFVNFFYRTSLGCKILGFPIRIDKKYARNAFYFNLCFVCDACARSVQFEPVVKKPSDHLVRLFTGDVCNYKDIYLCVQCFFMKNMLCNYKDIYLCVQCFFMKNMQWGSLFLTFNVVPVGRVA
jgi:hypothetical protein